MALRDISNTIGSNLISTNILMAKENFKSILKEQKMSLNKQVKLEKRNARERKRVQQVNFEFQKLRKLMLNANGSSAQLLNENKRISKVKTLHTAIEYIKYLQNLLESSNNKIEQFQMDSMSTDDDDYKYETINNYWYCSNKYEMMIPSTNQFYNNYNNNNTNISSYNNTNTSFYYNNQNFNC